jgi:cytoskeletal protein CcmA (bactofilin family)
MSDEESNLVTIPQHGSRISRCMVIDGNLKSCESMIIDGTVNGNIVCEEIVVIQKSGIVKGKIEAKAILLEGIVEGPLEAADIELGISAKLTGYILANRARIAGMVDGDILSKNSLEVCKDARVLTYECVSPHILVKGFIRGEVRANELLDIRSGATIEGDVQVKELQTEGSGNIFGAISRFVDNVDADN